MNEKTGGLVDEWKTGDITKGRIVATTGLWVQILTDHNRVVQMEKWRYRRGSESIHGEMKVQTGKWRYKWRKYDRGERQEFVDGCVDLLLKPQLERNHDLNETTNEITDSEWKTNVEEEAMNVEEEAMNGPTTKNVIVLLRVIKMVWRAGKERMIYVLESMLVLEHQRHERDREREKERESSLARTCAFFPGFIFLGFFLSLFLLLFLLIFLLETNDSTFRFSHPFKSWRIQSLKF